MSNTKKLLEFVFLIVVSGVLATNSYAENRLEKEFKLKGGLKEQTIQKSLEKPEQATSTKGALQKKNFTIKSGIKTE